MTALVAQQTAEVKCRWATLCPVAMTGKEYDSQVQSLTQALTSCHSRRVHFLGCCACWSATAASCARCAARQAGSPAHTAPAGSAAPSPLHSPCRPRREEDLCMPHVAQHEVHMLTPAPAVEGWGFRCRALLPQNNAKCEHHA